MRAFAVLAGAIFAAGLTVPLSTAGPPDGNADKPKNHWVKNVTITEYYPAPERWFDGRKVKAPGIKGKHHVDWLYSSSGIAMEGDGLGLDGKRYHLATYGPRNWVAADGKPTAPVAGGGWTHGWPAWRTGGWRNKQKEVTYPLQGGGWSNEKSVRYIKPKKITFASGPSLPLKAWKSIAVDPGLIPIGSKVFVPVYCSVRGHGWFKAEDTGAAISRRHIDVYRTPPKSEDGAASYSGEKIYVLKPDTKAPKSRPTCADFKK